jgi:hypothetical protein
MTSVSKPFVYNNCISVKAASENSGYSQQYLRRMLRLGKLAGLKFAQVWLVDLKSLELFFHYPKLEFMCNNQRSM